MKKEIIKSFDLASYKNGAKVKTKNGHEVRIICTDNKNECFPIIALIKIDDNHEATMHYTSEGKLLRGAIGDIDLVIVEEVEESEDERISKWIRKELESKYVVNNLVNNVMADKALAWLEKQGTQPRYNIGDVICDLSCNEYDIDAQLSYEIIDIRNGMYICDNGSIPISQQDEYRLVAKKAEQKPVNSINNDDDSVSNELREASFIFAARQMVHKASPEERKLELISSFEEGAKWQAAQEPTWSEEDEEILDLIIARLHSHADVDVEEYSKEYDWLNSPKVEYTWKPSDEQIEALNYVVNLMASSGSIRENDYYYNVFKDLREQLKKLK